MTVHRPLSELDRSILAYLQKHGPSSTAEMRAAGLKLEHNTMRRLHDDGYVRRAEVSARPDRRNEHAWRLV